MKQTTRILALLLVLVMLFATSACVKGDKGDTGAQGIQGEKGDKGDTGAQGIQGEKGDKGDTGAQGIQGEKGDKGDTGVGVAKVEIAYAYKNGSEYMIITTTFTDGTTNVTETRIPNKAEHLLMSYKGGQHFALSTEEGAIPQLQLEPLRLRPGRDASGRRPDFAGGDPRTDEL